jgi:predicted CXXCH cytochrome family protein
LDEVHAPFEEGACDVCHVPTAKEGGSK